MTRDDIIRMAREAGAWSQQFKNRDVEYLMSAESLERFAALVAAAERKRLHDKFMEIHNSQQHSNNYWHFAARKIMEEPDVA